MAYILPKGKYKGVEVSQVQDRGYLEWCLNNWDLGPLERKALEDAINPSREISKPMVGQTYVTQEAVKKAADFIIGRLSVISPEASPGHGIAQAAIKEMYKMLTGKDYI